MKSYYELSREELATEQQLLLSQYKSLQSLSLKLDMTRGKPGAEQLDLSQSMNQIMGDEYLSQEGDCRNYGIAYGIKEIRELFAQILGTTSDKVIAGNNSSLSMMFDAMMRAMVFGEIESEKPWAFVEKRKWLCPVPGYDRHFSITRDLGFEMINIPMNQDGPDMDIVEALVAADSSIKGMWCLPLYSNPDGYVYSEETCRRLVSMKTAASDFRIFWDNAYVVHHLYEDNQGTLPDILALADEMNHPNRVYQFASMSKITFPGSGIACMSCNDDNINRAQKILATRSIGPDKMNQLRHAKFLPNLEAVKNLMKKHAQVLLPKFNAVENQLNQELGNLEIATWNSPLGGYFISLYVVDGTAKKVVQMAKDAGVALTPAGATFPYGIDPSDNNIRIAPTFPSVSDIIKAMNVLTVCVKLAAVEKLLGE